MWYTAQLQKPEHNVQIKTEPRRMSECWCIGTVHKIWSANFIYNPKSREKSLMGRIKAHGQSHSKVLSSSATLRRAGISVTNTRSYGVTEHQHWKIKQQCRRCPLDNTGLSPRKQESCRLRLRMPGRTLRHITVPTDRAECCESTPGIASQADTVSKTGQWGSTSQHSEFSPLSQSCTFGPCWCHRKLCHWQWCYARATINHATDNGAN